VRLRLSYKREDQLWFSFFHEAGHVTLHGRRDTFVDFAAPSDDKREVQANRFGADYLIASHAYAHFTACVVIVLKATDDDAWSYSNFPRNM
jgi:HTH-type transcriptional regulator / antitoxin HigA